MVVFPFVTYLLTTISVRDHCEAAILDYVERSRSKWMQKWPGMCVLNCSQVHWTSEMENAMTMEGTKGVQKMLEQQKIQLSAMTKLVRGKLKKNARTSIGALTVVDVHARDVTIGLVSECLWMQRWYYFECTWKYHRNNRNNRLGSLWKTL